MSENKKTDKKEELSRINSQTVEIKKAQIYSRKIEIQETQLRSGKVAENKSKLDSKSGKE